MITLKEQEIYRILQTKDPAIAKLEGYGIKKKVKMFVEKNPHYRNIDFTINDYDKQIYSEATRLMVRGLLLNGYSQQDIYGINREINKLAESFYKMPLHKILSENGVSQVIKLLEKKSKSKNKLFTLSEDEDDTPLDFNPETWSPLPSANQNQNQQNQNQQNQGQQNQGQQSQGQQSQDKKNEDKAKIGFLANMAKKVFEWAKNANIPNFGINQIEKVKKFMTPVEGESDAKSLGRMITGWIAIISAVVGAAFLAKWLIKLFLKAVKGGVNLLKKFFAIFSAKTKIPLETPNE